MVIKTAKAEGNSWSERKEKCDKTCRRKNKKADIVSKVNLQIGHFG